MDEDLKKLSLQKLKKRCKHLKISTEGSKTVLITRIIDKTNESDNKTNESDNDDEKDMALINIINMNEIVKISQNKHLVSSVVDELCTKLPFTEKTNFVIATKMMKDIPPKYGIKLLNDMDKIEAQKKTSNTFAFEDEKEIEYLMSENGNKLGKIYELNKSHTMELDLTEALHHEWAYKMADILLESKVLQTMSDFNNLETLITKKLDSKLMTVSFHLAVRLARSRMKMIEINSQEEYIYISYLFPVYKETQRIKPKSEYKNGENFLYEKVRQLLWIFRDCSYVKWRLIVVDDGCPDGSGKLIETKVSDVSAKIYDGLDIVVIYLKDVINNKEYSLFSDMKSTKDSQKGGAVHYGLYYASQINKPECKEFEDNSYQHIICMTDADLSSDLGITGLLLHNFMCNKYKFNAKMSIPERYDNRSGYNSLYCTKFGGTHLFAFDMVNLALRGVFRSYLLPYMKNIVDSQCGFKFIDATVVPQIIHKLKDRSFTVDMELILTLYNHFKNTQNINLNKLICSEPIVWIESVSESAFWSEVGEGISIDSAKSYYKMIQNMIKLHDEWFKDKYEFKDDEIDMIQFIKKLTFDQYFKITKYMFENEKNPKEIILAEWSASIQQFETMINSS